MPKPSSNAAPQAAPVADRWHLLKNLSDLIERFFIQHHFLLTATAAQLRGERLAKESEINLPPPKESNQIAADLKPTPARRQKLFDLIKELQAKGKPIRAIARELKIARNTVKRYLYCETAPCHQSGAGKPSAVLPFADYLESRWRMGEQNGFRLWQEIKTQGFPGEVDSVQRFIRPWRNLPIGKTSFSVPMRGLAPRQAAKLLLNINSTASEAEQEYVAKLVDLFPVAAKIRQLGISFQEIVRERRADLFDDWLKEVETSAH